MKWFKHYTNSMEGETLQEFCETFGLTGYAFWFILLEIFYSKMDDENSVSVKIHRSIMRSRLKLNYNKIESLLSLGSTLGALRFSQNGNVYEIEICNMLKYMGRDEKRSRHERAKENEKARLDKNRLDKNIHVTTLHGEGKPSPRNAKQKEVKEKSKKELTKNVLFEIEFREAFKKRYHSAYKFTGKDRGIIGRMVKDFAEDDVRKLVSGYLQMNDSWFLTKNHDIVTLENNINKVMTFVQTGKMITTKEAGRVEETAHANPELDERELQRVRVRKILTQKREHDAKQIDSTKNEQITIIGTDGRNKNNNL